MKRWSAWLLLVLCAMLPMGAMAGQPYVDVVAGGERQPLWQVIRLGCDEAAAAQGAALHFAGPPTEADLAWQADALAGALDRRPDALCVAALDEAFIGPLLAPCAEEGIPVIAFAAGLQGAPEGVVRATVLTDNRGAGALAAEKLLQQASLYLALKEATPEAPVVIAVLAEEADSPAVAERIAGFLDAITASAGLHGLVSVAGPDSWADEVEGASVAVHITMIAQDALALEGLHALFCTSGQAASTLLAATDGGAAFGAGCPYEGVLVAGFDAGLPQKQAVRQGWFVGAVTQDLYQLGYQAVTLALAAAGGEAVQDTAIEAAWYTAQNMDTMAFIFNVYD